MNEPLSTNHSDIVKYHERTRRSAEKHRLARELLPSGIVHDARYMKPHPIYAERAFGSRKWDIDGNEYIDYYGGHGSNILGHCHPEVVAAVQRQIAKGSQLAACSELEVEWAQLISSMVPSAERVRFTSSGTEATHMAFRLARASTGKSKIIRFRNHFHGWHDHVAFGVHNHMDGSPTSGVIASVAENVILVDSNDTQSVERLIEQDSNIAAVILEPLGASSGTIPTTPGVLKKLRNMTLDHGILLIFDEVVSAFRVSPGGVQAHHNIIPDITTMAKIIAGGLPGGAVGARKNILDRIDHDAAKINGFERINHQGTHNANLVSAAAGITTLNLVKTTDACGEASRIAAILRKGMNETLAEEKVPWAVYGEYSFFHIFTNPNDAEIVSTAFDVHSVPASWLNSDKREDMLGKLRIGLLVRGVDFKSWKGGMLSAVHSDHDVDETLSAWRQTLRRLKREGDITPR